MECECGERMWKRLAIDLAWEREGVEQRRSVGYSARYGVAVQVWACFVCSRWVRTC